MEQKSYAVLVSNAGVVVVHKGVRILLDGLYKDLGKNFTDLPEWAWKLMKKGKGELGNVDYLLFSHSHYDHYYSPYFYEYMAANEVKGICFPPMDDTPGLAAAQGDFADKKIKLDYNNEAILEQGIKLKVFTTRHVDKQFYHVKNQCFRLDLDGVKLGFLSDVDYYEEDFAQEEDFTADIAFVTPIFYNHPKGRRILRDIMKVKETIIYHLPSPEDDRFMYYKMAQRDVEKYAQEGEKVLVWNESGQNISF
ncbi:MBL fold metallo-hydrolase [Anaerotignum sp. MB30-C6]|uniref:MBL fold metallo-hydrolase n=1 Tax=Anaerotignum sp. MB30-C6 TaxID=3070814 RepID=UPI0027DB4BBA|nr:MBL fold metallo-hydrolase [Anaerotignum sp. MB30-C6]WMI81783.1 MBL fold metallo-hydrolase [Anaerotignum sp. MB30-C6]